MAASKIFDALAPILALVRRRRAREPVVFERRVVCNWEDKIAAFFKRRRMRR